MTGSPQERVEVAAGGNEVGGAGESSNKEFNVNETATNLLQLARERIDSPSTDRAQNTSQELTKLWASLSGSERTAVGIHLQLQGERHGNNRADGLPKSTALFDKDGQVVALSFTASTHDKRAGSNGAKVFKYGDLAGAGALEQPGSNTRLQADYLARVRQTPTQLNAELSALPANGEAYKFHKAAADRTNLATINTRSENTQDQKRFNVVTSSRELLEIARNGLQSGDSAQVTRAVAGLSNIQRTALGLQLAWKHSQADSSSGLPSVSVAFDQKTGQATELKFQAAKPGQGKLETLRVPLTETRGSRKAEERDLDIRANVSIPGTNSSYRISVPGDRTRAEFISRPTDIQTGDKAKQWVGPDVQTDQSLLLVFPAAYTAKATVGPNTDKYVVNGPYAANGDFRHEAGGKGLGGLVLIDKEGKISIQANRGESQTEQSMRAIASSGGSAFQQHLLYINGTAEQNFKDSNQAQRRALLDFGNGKIALVESNGAITLNQFASDIAKLGQTTFAQNNMQLKAAVNLDMGSWSSAYHRTTEAERRAGNSAYMTLDGKDHRQSANQTNWILIRTSR